MIDTPKVCRNPAAKMNSQTIGRTSAEMKLLALVKET